MTSARQFLHRVLGRHDPIECGCELPETDAPHPFFDQCKHGVQFLDQCDDCPGGWQAAPSVSSSS